MLNGLPPETASSSNSVSSTGSQSKCSIVCPLSINEQDRSRIVLRQRIPPGNRSCREGIFGYGPVMWTLLSTLFCCATAALFEIVEFTVALIAEAMAEILMLKGLPPATASSSHSVSSISSYIANVLSVSANTSSLGLRPKQRLAFPNVGFSLRSRDVDAVVDAVRLRSGGTICDSRVYRRTDCGERGADVDAEGVAAGHGVKLALCQFNKFIHR